jgi:hypothetical protein
MGPQIKCHHDHLNLPELQFAPGGGFDQLIETGKGEL